MDKNQPEAVRTLHDYGVIVKSDHTLKFSTGDEVGRADLMCIRGGRGFMIEVKRGDTGFDLTQWRDNQRAWAATYCRPEPYGTEYWVWLTIGKHPPHYSPEKYLPRRTWLVPYIAMMAVDTIVRPIQNILPYQATTGMRREIQDNQLDAMTLLPDYELQWAGKGVWTIPDSHVFHRMYIAPEPLPLIDAGINAPERVPVTG